MRCTAAITDARRFQDSFDDDAATSFLIICADIDIAITASLSATISPYLADFMTYRRHAIFGRRSSHAAMTVFHFLEDAWPTTLRLRQPSHDDITWRLASRR